MRRAITLSLLVLLAGSAAARAAVPQTISYQGILREAGGTIVADGDYALTFKLYSAASGGTALWIETQTLAVVDGVFNALLGSLTPLGLDFASLYWLGVAVGGGAELTPRIALAAAPYSLNADRLDGLSNESFAGANHTHALDALSDVSVPAPTDGQVLSYSGGQWVAAGLGGGGDDGDWVISGGDIYRLTGRVGIGTSSPQSPLDLQRVGSAARERIKGYANNPNASAVLRLAKSRGSALGQDLSVQLGDTLGLVEGVGVNASNQEGLAGSIAFLAADTPGPLFVPGYISLSTCDGTSPAAERLRIGSGGQVTLFGSLDATGHLLRNLQNPNSAQDAATMSYVDYSVSSAATWTRNGNDLYRVVGTDTLMAIRSDGKVGIGTTAPSQRLQVAGGLRLVDGSQGSGKVLTSDATGVGSWQNPAVVTDSDWTIAGNDISHVPGKVGVGTASPQAKLHVQQTAAETAFRVDDEAGDPTPFIIDDEGRVGVQTANPGYALDVAGDLRVTGAIHGTADDAIDADQLDGYHAGNAAGQVPVSNGSLATNLNADQLDGYHAGNAAGQVPVSNGSLAANLNADKLDGYHLAELRSALLPAQTLEHHGGTWTWTESETFESFVSLQGSGELYQLTSYYSDNGYYEGPIVQVIVDGVPGHEIALRYFPISTYYHQGAQMYIHYYQVCMDLRFNQSLEILYKVDPGSSRGPLGAVYGRDIP